MLTQEQREHIQGGFKIPVDSFCPATYWIISVDSESNMPTDEELRRLRSYCEFVVGKTYGPNNKRKILEEKDLPREAGYNTTIFRKGNEMAENSGDAWFYRQSSWSQGPLFMPFTGAEDYRAHTLAEVMDRRENSMLEKWSAWKSEYPEIFSIPEGKEE